MRDLRSRPSEVCEAKSGEVSARFPVFSGEVGLFPRSTQEAMVVKS